MTLSVPVYQKPQATPFMAITSVALDVEMSTPSVKFLTVEQKADLYGNRIVWTLIENEPTSLLLLSPTSGKTYKISYAPKRGEWTCSCAAKGRCYHMVTFEREWLEAMVDLTKAEAVSVYSQTIPIKRNGFASRDSFLAARRADFGE